VILQHRRVLHRVGWVLIGVGAIDAGFMIYSMVNRISYSSSFSILAVVAGIFLVRGSMGAARVVTWFVALTLGALAALPVALPLILPIDLLLLRLRAISAGVWMLTALLVALLIWIYRQLRRTEVLTASQAAGLKTGPPRLAIAEGVALIIVLAIAMQVMVRGESGRRAIQLAQDQVGAGYRFHVESLQWRGDQVSARVAAYNESEIKDVVVRWEK
jgi:hypothetical protein